MVFKNIFLTLCLFVLFFNPSFAENKDEANIMDNEFIKNAITGYQKALAKGDGDAGYRLGNMHKFTDYEKAFDYYNQAFRLNHKTAGFHVGAMMIEGKGVKKDEKSGLAIITELAKDNQPEALSYLGGIYYFGKMEKQDYKKAFKYVKKSANLGCEKAYYLLATMYFNGQGVKKDYYEAYKWFKITNVYEYPEVRNFLKIVRANIAKENAKNIKDEQENKEYPPEISDIINGILALEYEDEIIEGLKSKIDYEINKGQVEFELGAIYLEKVEGKKDIETIRNLHKQAFEYFEKSAKKGYGKAYTMLCSNGFNNDKVYSESIKYCKEAVKKGEWYSAQILDEAYMYGKNVRIDMAESYKWRRVAIYLNRDENPYEGKLEALYETYDKEEGRIRFVKWAKKHKELYQPFN